MDGLGRHAVFAMVVFFWPEGSTEETRERSCHRSSVFCIWFRSLHSSSGRVDLFSPLQTVLIVRKKNPQSLCSLSSWDLQSLCILPMGWHRLSSFSLPRRGLSQYWLERLANKPQDPPCCLPSMGTKGIHHPA